MQRTKQAAGVGEDEAFSYHTRSVKARRGWEGLERNNASALKYREWGRSDGRVHVKLQSDQ